MGEHFKESIRRLWGIQNKFENFCVWSQIQGEEGGSLGNSPSNFMLVQHHLYFALSFLFAMSDFACVQSLCSNSSILIIFLFFFAFWNTYFLCTLWDHGFPLYWNLSEFLDQGSPEEGERVKLSRPEINTAHFTAQFTAHCALYTVHCELCTVHCQAIQFCIIPLNAWPCHIIQWTAQCYTQ